MRDMPEVNAAIVAVVAVLAGNTIAAWTRGVPCNREEGQEGQSVRQRWNPESQSWAAQYGSGQASGAAPAAGELTPGHNFTEAALQRLVEAHCRPGVGLTQDEFKQTGQGLVGRILKGDVPGNPVFSTITIWRLF